VHRGKLGRWLLSFALRAWGKRRPGRYPQINQFSFNIEICVHRFPNPSFRQSQPADKGASNTTGRQANFVNQTSLKLSGAWLPYCCPKVCARRVPDVELKMKLKIVFRHTSALQERFSAPRSPSQPPGHLARAAQSFCSLADALGYTGRRAAHGESSVAGCFRLPSGHGVSGDRVGTLKQNI
jgi:hypothetical protein